MTDITARLNSLKNQIEQGKVAKTNTDKKLRNFRKQRDEVVKEMADLGVTPETVDQEIERLEQEIEESLKQAEELLKG